jgi:magnesium chelatase subunit H
MQGMRESGRAVQIANTIVETARQCNLDKDINLPEEDAADLDIEARDKIIGSCYQKLMEIESRLLPCGLHIVGVPPTAMEAIATLVNIAEIDRPEQTPVPLKGIPTLLASAVGRDIEDVYNGNNKGLLEDVALVERITQMSRQCVTEFVNDRTGADGRIGSNPIASMMKYTGFYREPWVRALSGTEFAKADRQELVNLFNYLEFCLTQIVKDNELGALAEGLRGEYVMPGPGGDPIRNPGVLPTGKNLHALDPQSIPTAAAVKGAKTVVDRLLEREAQVNGGKYPESIALVLWGTDNIKTYGESLAQVRIRPHSVLFESHVCPIPVPV